MPKRITDGIEDEPLDKLAEQLRDVDPERLKTILRKSARIEIRVSSGDYESVTEEAGRRGLSITNYLLDCHREAKRRAAREEKGK